MEESDITVVVRATQSVATVGDAVLTSESGAVVTAIGGWSYIPEGSITVVQPTSGQLGTVVTISGNSLCGGGAAVERVLLATFDADIQSQSNCGLVVVSARDYGASVTGDILLISNTGALVTRTDSWTYLASGLITEVVPGAGQGGSPIAIRGAALFGAGGSAVREITLAGVPATIQQASSTAIIVTANEGPIVGEPQRGDVVITVDGAVCPAVH